MLPRFVVAERDRSTIHEVALPEGVIPVVDRGNLVALKLYAGGPQDLLDVALLLEADPNLRQLIASVGVPALADPKKMLVFRMRRLKAVLQRHSKSPGESLTETDR